MGGFAVLSHSKSPVSTGAGTRRGNGRGIASAGRTVCAVAWLHASMTAINAQLTLQITKWRGNVDLLRMLMVYQG